MKIEKISTQIHHIPLKTPFATALRRVEAVEFVRVCILFENGYKCYGEAPATKAVTGEDLESISLAIEEITPKLLGCNREQSRSIVNTQMEAPSAQAALDMALYMYDYTKVQKYANTPLKSDITISLNDIPTMLKDARKALDRGVEILKVKVGADVAHAVAVSKALFGEFPQAQLLIDANQAWDISKSVRYIDATSDITTIALIEQPVVAKDLEGLGYISQYSNVPILADEAVFTLDDVKKVHQDALADMINIKLMKCGGVSKAVEILEYARQNNIGCMMGSMLEGPLSINAALYLAFLYRDVVQFVDLDSPMLYKHPSSELRFHYEKGKVYFEVGR